MVDKKDISFSRNDVNVNKVASSVWVRDVDDRLTILTEQIESIKQPKVAPVKYDDSLLWLKIAQLEEEIERLKNGKPNQSITLTDMLKQEGIELKKGSILIVDDIGVTTFKADQEGKVLTSSNNSIGLTWQSLK